MKKSLQVSISLGMIPTLKDFKFSQLMNLAQMQYLNMEILMLIKKQSFLQELIASLSILLPEKRVTNTAWNYIYQPRKKLTDLVLILIF